MQRLLRPIWRLPWPARFRRAAFRLAILPGIRLILFPHFMVGVVGLIRNEGGAVLLLRHTYRSKHPWGPPTGFLEHGEQPASALLREIGEETGFEVALAPQPGVYASAGHPILNVIYTGTFLEGTFTPGPEVAEARFFSLDDLPPLHTEQRALVLRLAEEVRH